MHLSKPDGRTLLGFALIAAVILAFPLMMFLLSDIVAAPFYLSAIQRALDEQCGQGAIQADAAGFTRDPVMSWWDRHSTTVCHFDTIADAWECCCP